MDALDDASAIVALRTSSESGVRQLVAQWTPSMLGLARAHTANETSAEDVVQDAWVTVLTSIDRFAGRSALRTWVLGIVVNTARRASRLERRTIPFSATPPADSEEELLAVVDPTRFNSHTGHWASPPLRWDLMPEEQLAARELRQVVDRAVATLPERQRAVMTARDMLGLSAEDVGALYGLRAGNQRVLLHRARGKVRAEVEAYAAHSCVADSPGRGDSTPTTSKPARARASTEQSGRQASGRQAAGRGEQLACRQLVGLVSDYLDDALDADLRDSIEEHLADCGGCTGYVAQVRRVLDVTGGLATTVTPHLVERLTAALRNIAASGTR